MALNKVMLIGNVGKDPEVRYLESGQQGPGGNAKVASFTLATSERYRDRNGEVRENTEWHNIVAWRNSADIVEKYVRKGTQLYIEGRLRTRKWTDREGKDRYTTEVVVDNLQLLGRRPDAPGEGAPQGSAYQQPAQGAYQQPAYQQPAPGGYPQNGYQQPVYQQAPPQYSQPAAPVPPAAPAMDSPEDDLPF